MAYRVYAMDTYFYTPHGHYPFEARCRMLKELGYDATYLTLWSERAWTEDLPKVAQVRRRHELDVAAVYVTIDPWAPADDPERQRIDRLVRTLEGCDTIEIATAKNRQGIGASDPAGDDAMARCLEPLLKLAHERGIKLCLYPHIGAWLERTEDAVRLCERMGHPNLGAMFCGFHWFAVDGQDVFGRLDGAKQWLAQVNLCGSRKSAAGIAGKATIEPLDDGAVDNFAILGHLRRMGYDGYIGFQGYDIGGDVYAKLRRSLAAFRDMESRLMAHEQWALCDPAPR